jgi:hypothetical protein
MKITERISLEKDGDYFKLTEVRESKLMDSNRKYTGEVGEKTAFLGSFSTVYQALIHIIQSDYDIEEDLISQYKELVSLIDAKADDIKRDFRTEVKTVITR